MAFSVSLLLTVMALVYFVDAADGTEPSVV
jgi:hypothetical protein